MADPLQILAGGVTGAILNQLWTEARGKFGERKDGKLAAMFLAAELDAYVVSCAERHQDIKNNDTSDGELGHPWRTIPEPPPISEKTNWRALGANLTQKVLRFRAVAMARNRELEGLYEIVGAEEAVSGASVYTVQSGAEADALAVELRTAFGVRTLDLGDAWDAAAYVRSEWRDIEEKRRQSEERAARRSQASGPPE